MDAVEGSEVDGGGDGKSKSQSPSDSAEKRETQPQATTPATEGDTHD